MKLTDQQIEKLLSIGFNLNVENSITLSKDVLYSIIRKAMEISQHRGVMTTKWKDEK